MMTIRTALSETAKCRSGKSRLGLARFGSRNVRLVAAAVGFLALTNPVWSADLPGPLPPAPLAPVPYSWTGFYIGLNAGYASIKDDQTLAGGGPGLDGSGSTRLSSAIGGAQFGANYQMGALVLGFEGDFDGSTATRSTAVAGVATGTDQVPWVATLRGRAGIAFDRLLVYATAGGAATQLNANVNIAAIGSTSTANTHGGWTAGGGIEAAITESLSARVEYLYVDTGNFNTGQIGAPPVVTVTGRLQQSLVRAGLDYRLPIQW